MSVSASTYVLFFERARKLVLALVLAVGLVLGGPPMFDSSAAHAAEGEPVGKLVAIIGKVFIERGGKKIPAKKGMEVMATDKLVTEKKSVAKISFKDGGSFMAFQDSAVTIAEYSLKKKGDKLSLKSAFDIAKGKVRFFVKPGKNRENDASYLTKNAVMGIRGTSGFIDTTKPGQTELVVTTGKVEFSNPAVPSRSVLVPAKHMSSIRGNAPPEVPKRAPAALLRSLNSEARSASRAGAADAEGNTGDAPAEQSDGEESESSSAGEEGEGDQAPAGEEGEADQAPAGEEGEGDQAPAGEEGEGSQAPAGEEGEGSQATGEDGQGETQSEPSSTEGKGQGESSGTDDTDGVASGDDSDSGRSGQPSGAADETAEPGDDGTAAQEQSGGVAPAEPAQSDGPGNSENTPAAENRPMRSQQGQNERPGGKPTVKKVTVFGQDGAASVSVSDNSMGDLTGPVQVETGVQARPGQGPSAAASNEVNVSTENVIRDVERAASTEKVSEQIQAAVQKAVDQSDPIVQALKEPVKKNVSIKVVLPE